MYITGMRKHSSIWPHIKEAEGGEWNEFKFDKQVNLFVGPNAAGKTRLLDLLYGQLRFGASRESSQVNLGYSESLDEWLKKLDIRGQVTGGVWDGEILKKVHGNLPVTYIDIERPDESRVKDKLHWVIRDMEEVRNSRMDSFNEDDRRIAGQKSVPGYDGRTASSILTERLAMRDAANEYFAVQAITEGVDFDNTVYHNSFHEAMIGKEITEIEEEDIFMYLTQSSSKADANFQKGMLLSYQCAKNICADVVVSDFPIHEPVLTENQGGVPSASVDYGVKIATSDTNLQGQSIAPLHISRLSSGTAGTLWWVRLLAFEMLDYYGFQFGWEKKPMILLIDEIENHLHPTWQRRVIPALLEHFPGLQIFATTHSPFVVAGREVGQVHQLIRDTNGLITAKTNTEPIKGLTADEISRKYLEVQDPTDLATAEAAQELRQLRDEGPRADEREEAERQKRMQQLRRLVDRDLLAGGPKARRREDFARRFREAMERRRQEAELNQDNG